MSDTRLADSIKRLGAVASTLEECESIDDVYSRAVATAERVIESDAVIICTVEDGRFVPQAANVNRLIPAEPLTIEDGIAGKTVREDRTYVVDDLESDPDAAPTNESFRSVLSVPLDGGGIVQFHSTERGAFSAVDRHLGELFVATVTNARNRVAYETALETERDQFAALFENVPDAALQYRIEDGRPIIDAVNSAFIRVFGYDAEDAVGEPVEKLLLPADERTESGAEPELTNAVELDAQSDIEVVRETASGLRPFLLRNVPVATDDETSRGYLIYTDLTELKVRERELRRKNERLDQFASIVSHDLRNPLSVANGHLKLALDRDGDATDELEEVRRAHERMDRLVEDLLAMARDGTVDDPAPVDLATVAGTAWNNVETATASLEVAADTRLAADRSRLLQLFENLFRNAIEHAGPDVTVRVEDTANGFAVADDGPGIPDDDREAVFESGYSGTTDNTGLGLAIVRQIAEEHGWNVEVTGGSDGGARFEFTDHPLESMDRLGIVDQRPQGSG
ncbi:sensor histidine kinase [Halopiger djelfimassiliensis]|uniref:sensor histidine kinase n=1 Tax=Halopiger djelfimassiliensis TaxID=1293047 RepID=UPI0006777AB4|nr:GAF domain-containing sensor histidine kinase [Halopiger djelfimassiliensis]